jgi:hypothetical protein
MPPPPAHWRKQEQMGQYSPLFGEFFIVCKRSVIGCDADRLDYASDEPDFINVHAGAACRDRPFLVYAIKMIR